MKKWNNYEKVFFYRKFVFFIKPTFFFLDWITLLDFAAKSDGWFIQKIRYLCLNDYIVYQKFKNFQFIQKKFNEWLN